MLEGNIVLFKTALAIFVILKKRILKTNNFEDIYEILNSGTSEIKDYSLIIHFLGLRKFEFEYEFLNANRNSIQIPIIENILLEKEFKEKASQNNKNKTVKLEEVDEKCDLSWPYCKMDKNFRHDILNCLVYQVSETPEIINDYFSNGDKSKKNSSLSVGNSNCDSKDHKLILTEKRAHVCRKFEDCKTNENSLINETVDESNNKKSEEDNSILYITLRN